MLALPGALPYAYPSRLGQGKTLPQDARRSPGPACRMRTREAVSAAGGARPSPYRSG